MLNDHRKSRGVVVGLLILVLLQACGMRMRPGLPVEAPADQAPFATQEESASPVPPTRIAKTDTPSATQSSPSPTPAKEVTITAVKGNLFIRRGPDLAFDPIGVLYKDSIAQVVARDVLSKWAQIAIPNSDDLGWVSLMTRFSDVSGDLQALSPLVPTDWPVPAYLRNCTRHEMVAEPGDIILPSLLQYPENLVWVYPGSYTVYDLDHPNQPDVADVQLREGITIDIGVDGFGERRKCPVD